MKATIQYGTSEYGYPFPQYDGELLSWSLGLYFTLSEAERNYPKMRTVIRAMMEKRPDQLERERVELVKASFDRVFGTNAKRCLIVIEEEAGLCKPN